MMKRQRVVIIGAGIGGLVTALLLSASGFHVTLIERALAPGGKLRQTVVDGRAIDVGPTVFTLKHIFEEIFNTVGLDFNACLPTRPVAILARHAWNTSEQLDLFADVQRSRDAIAAFAGLKEARGFEDFTKDAGRIWKTLEKPFVRAPAPDMMTLIRGAGLRGLSELTQIHPFATLWNRLGKYFHDQRLRQLFARYATYCGSSPFVAPATLMLVAHVEQQGVWTIDGGMHQLALVLADQAMSRGAVFRYGIEARDIKFSHDAATVKLSTGEVVVADRVVFNGDPAALANGLLGNTSRGTTRSIPFHARSLSAITWAFRARCEGFQPKRHNVFFSNHYRAEFKAIARAQYIEDPTVYLCAEDYGDDDRQPQSSDRYFALINAPANGDVHRPQQKDIDSWTRSMISRLGHCGLTFSTPPQLEQATTPEHFNTLFPATGGALYGLASHGWRASFQRPTARTRIPLLYLAGGGIHPGPGLPMAALSGWTAAKCVIEDSHSRILSLGMATVGGMSTHSPTIAPEA